MDILDPYYEYDDYHCTVRKERVFRNRSDPLESMGDAELYRKYRFDRAGILLLADSLNNLSSKTQRNHALPAHLKVLMGLRILGSNCFQNFMTDAIHVDQSTVSRAFDQFLDAMIEIVPQLIKWPANSEETKKYFFDNYRIPDVVGVIDGTHVQIVAPPLMEEKAYVNRLSYHSINVQAVCNEKSFIINCVANKPGSFHDSTILKVYTINFILMLSQFKLHIL